MNSRPEVLEAVKVLPTKQRAAVYLTFWCGMPSGEVGEPMGCRPATARRCIHIAKKRLAEVLNDDE